MAKKYNRVMLGRGGQFAEECFKGNYIGADFDIHEDLTPNLTDNWRKFNQHYIPIFQISNPSKSLTAAGLACGALWTICCGLELGDIVLCPRGNGEYLVGEISGGYSYVPGTILPHHRAVKWMNKVILRSDMPDKLRNSSGSIGTCCDITKHALAIEDMIAKKSHPLVPLKQTQSSVKPSTSSAKPKALQFDEIDLHKLFCTYLRDQKIFAKTIYHQKSQNNSNDRKWTHPDIVGVKFSELNTEQVKSLMNKIDTDKSVHIYAYEMKKEIRSDNELKQYFFQALSNSNWAHFGYLVAFDINEQLKEEMARLNAAFGIGIIRVQAHSTDTEILFEARENKIDYTTLDNLCNNNPDAREFIEKLTLVLNNEDSKTKKVFMANFEKDCDEIFKDDKDLDKYCQDKNIPY